MNVTIAVCGEFHYHNYVKYLDADGLLNQFIYSHQMSNHAAPLSVRQNKLVNIWPKEHLLRGHLKLLGEWMSATLFPLYHDLWKPLALKELNRCDIFHLMLHGTGSRLIQRAKMDGSLILGEPVNTHPEHVVELLNEEYERLGIRKRLQLSLPQLRLIEEAKECDHLLVASHNIRDSYIRKGFVPNRIHVLPYGVDLSRFSIPPAKDSVSRDPSFRVICVGHISPRKGQIDLLEAWIELHPHNGELLLIGSVSQEMKPILARYWGLFTHLPHVSNATLRDYYARSSVFVLPSVEDGFAAVCTEAMACGLPVITTTQTGASELLTHGQDGFVVPIRSPQAIAGYLDQLFQQPGLRRSMGQAAQAKARSSLCWEMYARKLCRLYEFCTRAMTTTGRTSRYPVSRHPPPVLAAPASG